MVRTRLLLLSLLLGLLAGPGLALATAPTADEVQATLAEVEQRIADARSQGDAGEALAELERWKSVLAELLEALRQRSELEDGMAVVDPMLGELMERGPPYSLATFDGALGRLAGLRAELAQLELAADSATDSLATARAALEKAERARRRAKEEESPRLEALSRTARIAQSRASLRELQAENAARAASGVRERLAATAGLPDRLLRGLVLTEADALAVMDRFDREEADLKRRLERAELDLQEAESRWSALQGQAAQGGEDARDRLALQRARLALRQKAVALLSEQLERLRSQRASERARLDALAGTSSDRGALLEQLESSRAAEAEFRRAGRLDRAELAMLEQEIEALDAQASDPVQKEHLGVLQARLALERSNLESLDRAVATEEALQQVLELRVGERTWADRLSMTAAGMHDVWSYELFSTDDRPITVGKILSALLLIVVGMALARLLRRLLEERMLPRLGLDDGACHAFAELAFYGMIVIIVLLSLQTVSIPLTAFAVLGGALAIGVGFGSQNVVNNFISGVILLAERPIKVGDLVDVNGTYGNVERIGARSTRIRTGNNIHVIVPNSVFLESNVINWTHQDPRVRISVAVGVAYGSPTREVERRIQEALASDPRIQKTPEPIVLFDEFGDNALQFSVHFWVQVRKMMDRLRIESDVRFRIDDAFREAGITIAFPQRDVHLDSSKPIDLRVRMDGTPTNSEES